MRARRLPGLALALSAILALAGCADSFDEQFERDDRAIAEEARAFDAELAREAAADDARAAAPDAPRGKGGR